MPACSPPLPPIPRAIPRAMPPAGSTHSPAPWPRWRAAQLFYSCFANLRDGEAPFAQQREPLLRARACVERCAPSEEAEALDFRCMMGIMTVRAQPLALLWLRARPAAHAGACPGVDNDSNTHEA